jgi:hypothetical protein
LAGAGPIAVDPALWLVAAARDGEVASAELGTAPSPRNWFFRGTPPQWRVRQVSLVFGLGRESRMETVDRLFSAMKIRDAIGDLADGETVASDLMPSVRAAVIGTCPTVDRGEQEFVVGVMQAGLFNVDTAELIWPRDPGHPVCNDNDVLLRVVTDPELWEQARQHWEASQPQEWTAFVWRIAVPLSNRLGLVGAWR